MFKTKANKTLDDILTGFSTVITDLEGLVQRNEDRVRENEQQIAQLAAENRGLTAEKAHAQSITEKLRSLLA